MFFYIIVVEQQLQTLHNLPLQKMPVTPADVLNHIFPPVSPCDLRVIDAYIISQAEYFHHLNYVQFHYNDYCTYLDQWCWCNGHDASVRTKDDADRWIEFIHNHYSTYWNVETIQLAIKLSPL